MTNFKYTFNEIVVTSSIGLCRSKNNTRIRQPGFVRHHVLGIRMSWRTMVPTVGDHLAVVPLGADTRCLAMVGYIRVWSSTEIRVSSVKHTFLT